MPSLKELSKKPELFTGGHRACVGCAFPIIIRQLMMAVDTPVVVGCATGCMEVATSIFPYTAWKVPFIHSAFENSAATVSGIEAAYRSLRKQGKYHKDVRFIAIGGDGGTYDIGLQSLSGAMERRHRMLYLCYNNEAYMNTGVQRSSATPTGAHTTTSPVGTVIPGKQHPPKDLTAIMVAHDIPYVAQASPSHWNDLITKVGKSLAVDDPSFINVISTCQLGWGHDPELTIQIARMAVDTCLWPLYEVVNGEYHLTHKPREKKPVEEYLKLQTRFRHLFAPQNKHLVEELQRYVDAKWEQLLNKCQVASQE